MRPTRVAGLVVVWVLISASWAYCQGKPTRRIPTPRDRAGAKFVSEETVENKKWEADGYGMTEKDAQNLALETVCKKVADYLSQNGLTDWRPEINDIRDITKPTFHHKESTFEDPQLGKMQHVTVEVELTPEAISKFEKGARDQRIGYRVQATAKGLGMFVALLVAMGGYFRLEEATKGYYTKLLRMMAVGFLGLVAASLWFAV